MASGVAAATKRADQLDRRVIAVLTLPALVAAAVAAGLGGAVAAYAIGDPGAVVRWSVPLVRAVRDVAAATTIGVLLWHTAGVSAVRGGLYLRTAPSSDALFASELYLVARRVGGLAPGLWHYAPQHHALALLQRGAAELGADPRTLGAIADRLYAP